MFRRPPKVKRRPDGTFELALDDAEREVIAMVLRDLVAQLDADPHHPTLQRLRPPAYEDDPDRDAEYQLLAGEELRSSHRAAVEVVLASLEEEHIDEDGLWSWLQALNAVRLVVGTRLDITEDDDAIGPRARLSPEERALWAVYDFTTYLQYAAIQALDT